MDKAFSNLLKHINKLTLTKKEQVYQWVKRYVDPSSSVGGSLGKHALKMGSSALIVLLSTLFVLENTKVANAIVVSLAERLSPIQQILFCIVLVKETNGLLLLIVCSKDIHCENQLKS